MYKMLGDHPHIVPHYVGTIRDSRGCANIFMEKCGMLPESPSFSYQCNLHISILTRFYFFDVQFIRSQDLIIIVLTVCRTILDDVTFKNLLDQLIIPQLIFSFILITFLLYIGRRNSVLEFKVNTTVFASFCRTISFRLHGVNIEETIDMWGSHVLLASDPCCS